MPGQVGQFQQSTFTSPAAGEARLASVVRGNDNNLRTKHNSHDADATIHALSGLLADRPAAGTSGRKFFATDALRWSYDNGTVWTDEDSATAEHTHAAADIGPGTFDAGDGSDFIVPNPLQVQSQGYSAQNDVGNSGAAKTIDWDDANCQKLTLDANTTLTFNNGAAGATYLLRVSQDATGARTITWPAAVHWPGGTAPTLTTTASKVDLLAFYFDGTTYFGSLVGANYTP